MNIEPIAKNATKLIKKTTDFLNVNSPTIFAGFAIAGVITTTAMAVRATTKARDILDEVAYTDPDTGEHVEPGVKEMIGATWKCYIPVAVSAGLTIGAVIMSHNIQSKRNVMLAGLYSTSQKALEDYHQKTTEILGKSKTEKINEAVVEDTLAKHPVEKATILDTHLGRSLCFDTWSGRYFWCDYEKIYRAESDFRLQLADEFRKPLNDFYGLLGLDSAGCGEEVGWTVERPIVVTYRSKLASDGTPCLVISYDVEPTPSFRNW